MFFLMSNPGDSLYYSTPNIKIPDTDYENGGKYFLYTILDPYEVVFF